MVDVVVKGILNLSIILNTTARDSKATCHARVAEKIGIFLPYLFLPVNYQ